MSKIQGISWVQISGLTAMLGGGLGILLTLPFVYGSFLWYSAPLDPFIFHAWVEAIFPVETGSAWQVYAGYGQAYFLTLLPQAAGLLALYELLRSSQSRAAYWGLRISLHGLALSLVGLFADFWLPLPPRFLAASLGALLMLAGFILLGVAAARSPQLPRWLILPLVLVGPALLPAMYLVYGHIPSGPLLPFHAAWIVLGYALWSYRLRPSRAIPVNH